MSIDQPDVMVPMSDGVDVAVRIYRPDGPGPFPTLFAASPYRYDNDDLPPSMVFFWFETGPIHFYVQQGYAYVHLDVRGTGKSGGEFGYFDRRERRDLYEVIEWIAAQPWSNGKVGGIGQSYYAASQWAMASERPPHLACVAPFDGHFDLYRGWNYQGGMRSNYISGWWNNSVRIANKFPANGSEPRDIPVDMPAITLQHPTFDAYWEERDFSDKLREVDIPVYSIGTWIKRERHLGGNLRAYQLVSGPKKLKVFDHVSGAEALKVFETVAFHSEVMLPFYDHWLKGLPTGYTDRPDVECALVGANRTYQTTTWPPTEVSYLPLYLAGGPTGSVTSLNDGALAAEPLEEAQSTTYSYPGANWVFGPVVMTRQGPDTVQAVLTFTSAPLEADVDVVGPIELEIHVSSTRTDMNVVSRLAEQLPQEPADRAAGRQPASKLVSKGWLKASHRALDEAQSVLGAPVHLHTTPEPLVPGQVVALRVALVGCGHRFQKGSRIRLELSCGDTTFTDSQFAHAFTPDMVGSDTVHFGLPWPSKLILPVVDGGAFRFASID
ncbi:CocE/NonD family hydrolase [Paraburkholderia sediminicola]|uniref:CocE/NonD family hydrolase n=1 Tax=Paraburkholderia sediminicola TaxID=458836 RepID=UPI0038B94A6E